MDPETALFVEATRRALLGQPVSLEWRSVRTRDSSAVEHRDWFLSVRTIDGPGLIIPADVVTRGNSGPPRQLTRAVGSTVAVILAAMGGSVTGEGLGTVEPRSARAQLLAALRRSVPGDSPALSDSSE